MNKVPQLELPLVGEVVEAKIQHYFTKTEYIVDLVHVDESDCTWRTADDYSELEFEWQVIGWNHK